MQLVPEKPKVRMLNSFYYYSPELLHRLEASGDRMSVAMTATDRTFTQKRTMWSNDADTALLDGFLGGLLEAFVVEAAKILACSLLLVTSSATAINILAKDMGISERFPFDELHAVKNPGPENVDGSETEDDDDEDDNDDEDQADNEDEEEDDGEANGGNEGDPEDEPEANADGNEDDDEDDEEDDDKDDDEEEDEEDEEEEEDEDELPQPPTKKRK